MKSKRSIMVGIIMLILLVVLSGCESAVQIPKEELKRIAVSKLHSEYENAEYVLVDETYYQENQIYELSYAVTQPSSYGFTNEKRRVTARFVYDPASKKWRDSKINCSELSIIPNLTNIGTNFFAQSPLGGTVSIQILSLDPDQSIVTVNITEDNLTVQAEHHISRLTYTINRDEKGLVCNYFTSNISVDEVLIDLGEANGAKQLLLLRKEPFSNTPQFSLYTGNESFEGLNAILDLERR